MTAFPPSAAHPDTAPREGVTTKERRARASALLAALLVMSCTEIGPTVHVEAGAEKSQAAWDDDHRVCMAETDRAVQPFANGLNVDLGRTADQVRSDNGRIQQAYDDHYGHCMASLGNRVAGLAPVQRPAPMPDDAVGQAQEALDLSPVMDSVSASAARSVEAKVKEFRGACPGEVIAVNVRLAPISRTAVTRLVALTEPHGGACFGNKGEVDYLVMRRDERWQTLLEGLLTLAESKHAGFADIDLQSAGLCTKTFRWNGKGYAQAGEHDC
jgi:hypothetical protein